MKAEGAVTPAGRPAQRSDSHGRRIAPRRIVRGLIGVLALLVAMLTVPGPMAQASFVPAGSGLLPFVFPTPEETTLTQFTQFTVDGSSMPPGTANVRLRGVFAGTITVASDGSVPSTTFAVPSGAAQCGQDEVTLDEGGPVLASNPITVYCPTLTISPSPVFSAGAATDLHLTATGLGPNRFIDLAIDGQSLPQGNSNASGAITDQTIAGSALACGTHQLTATIEPPPIELKIRHAAVRPAIDFPLPTATTTITVLGCATSTPAPVIFADPFETTLAQFTAFSVGGFDLAAGPATVKLGGVVAGTVNVGVGGSFPTTDFAVPAGAASCGTDVVTIDDVTPAIAQSPIAVYCPVVTVTPNPVFSGGAPADLSIAATGFPGNRDVDFTIDGTDLGTVTSDAGGAVTKAETGIALTCGTHQVVATAQPLPQEGLQARAAAVGTVPFDPPMPAQTEVTVLGCANSPTPPQIHAIPIETALGEFTRFQVDGSLLPAGPANIKLRGVDAGTVQVSGKGILNPTDFTVPAKTAQCGQDAVTLDKGGPVLATTAIAVYCPTITVAPNPVDSGGHAAALTVTGTGFPANRTIDLGFDGQNRTVVTSDANGAVHGPIGGITPACGKHQAVATARPPAAAAGAGQGAVLSFLPVSASAPVIVVGCARLKADPSVIEQGMLTHVTGTGFLPKVALTLTWLTPAGQALTACSPDAISAPAVTADAAGNVNVFCLAFIHGALGTLQISAFQNPEREKVPVVIEAGPMQPSSGDQFVFRR
jgi:hypothetical protein